MIAFDCTGSAICVTCEIERLKTAKNCMIRDSPNSTEKLGSVFFQNVISYLEKCSNLTSIIHFLYMDWNHQRMETNRPWNNLEQFRIITALFVQIQPIRNDSLSLEMGIQVYNIPYLRVCWIGHGEGCCSGAEFPGHLFKDFLITSSTLKSCGVWAVLWGETERIWPTIVYTSYVSTLAMAFIYHVFSRIPIILKKTPRWYPYGSFRKHCAALRSPSHLGARSCHARRSSGCYCFGVAFLAKRHCWGQGGNQIFQASLWGDLSWNSFFNQSE